MASKPSHPRLADHNARVRRWVKDFDDDTLHPVLLVLGYGVDLDDSTYKYNIVAIANGMARYRKGKVPGRATVFRQLAKLESLGVIKSADQFGPTGRQKITHRIMDFRQAVRFGQPVEHLWDAPLPPGETPNETPNETPGETPNETPGETPNETPLLSTISELSKLADYLPGQRENGSLLNPSGKIEEQAESTSYNNSYFVGTSKFRKVKGAPRRGEIRADLSAAEALFMWTHLQDYSARLGFLKGSAGHRATLLAAEAQRAAQARAEHEAAAEVERQAEEAARQEAQAEREARRAALRAEFEQLSARYDGLYGRPGEADRMLTGNLCGPGGMPRLEVQVEHLREHVGQREYYEAHKDDPPWNGDPSTLKVPSWADGTYRGRGPVPPGKVFHGWVTDAGDIIRFWEGHHRPGMAEGYFRWTPENGLELAEPVGEA